MEAMSSIRGKAHLLAEPMRQTGGQFMGQSTQVESGLIVPFLLGQGQGTLLTEPWCRCRAQFCETGRMSEELRLYFLGVMQAVCDAEAHGLFLGSGILPENFAFRTLEHHHQFMCLKTWNARFFAGNRL